jgi:hypothetical protein
VGVDTIHDGFFSQQTTLFGAVVFVNFRGKKRAKRREVTRLLTPKQLEGKAFIGLSR